VCDAARLPLNLLIALTVCIAFLLLAQPIMASVCGDQSLRDLVREIPRGEMAGTLAA
jgi:hypothetical protein